MSQHKNIPKPPPWLDRLLAWRLPAEQFEEVQGDMHELYHQWLAETSVPKARMKYALNALTFLRPLPSRKPSFQHKTNSYSQANPIDMFRNYFIIAFRNLTRQKTFSLINIIGLSISMSVGLLVIAFLLDLLSYDDFHEKKDRMYRVTTTTNQFLDQPLMNLASTSVKAGKRIRETIAGIEELTVLRNGFGGDARIGEKVMPLSGLWADASFFKVFTFPLLQGNAATALQEPYSLVLTETSARKLFGQADALGKSVQFDTLNYTVTGVMKDIPKLSHMNFESLGSFVTAELQQSDGDGSFFSWESIYSNYVYLLLPEDSDPKTLQANLMQLSAAENARIQNKKITLSLQPLQDISIGKKLQNQIGPTMLSIGVWVLGCLSFVIILSACFNYTNLSIARSLRRSREVGIRKVVGALRIQVLGQFMAESVLTSLIALVFSLLLFLFLRTQFLSLDPFLQRLVSLDLSPALIGYFVALAITVGIIAGLLPALFFSRLNAIEVLKNTSSLKLFRHLTMRKTLIVMQYTFSLIFITTTLIGYNQYRSFLTFDLGFTTENILNIKLQGNKGELLKNELAGLPAINGIATSRIITSLGSNYGTSMKYKNPADSLSVWLNFVDEQYLPLHRHTFIAGKNFSARPTNGEESEVIVNEQVLKRFDIAKQDPQKALGEMLTVDGKKLTIVGVLKNFHYETVEDPIEPTIFRYSADEPGGYLNVKITSNDLPATLVDIENAWKKIDKVHPLEARFYDAQIEQAYSQFLMMVKVIGFLAFLAVCIASMGLFGMVVYTTETRLKEISIRKVMGASEGNLIYLLSKGFIFLLTIAALIALPVTYLFFDKVILSNFAYHQPIGLGELVLGVVIVMLVAMIMIGSQTLTVARRNPAKVLRNE